MGLPTESVKLRQGVKVEIDNQEVTFVRVVAGGGFVIPQVDVTNASSNQQDWSTGRASHDHLVIKFSNSKKTVPLLTKIASYFKAPQTSARSTIAVSEIVRDGGTLGNVVSYFDCFPVTLTLPQGNAASGVLETEMSWCIHRAEWAAGGVSQ